MHKNSSSFRDPSGFIFEHQGQIYRNINLAYAEHFEFLTSSGLLEALFHQDLLIRHQPAKNDLPMQPETYRIIRPERIPVITYPYEWSFTQLKEAALLTLKVLAISLKHGMILKDASAYNVQFTGYKPVFIDTLSFEIYQEGQIWKGYKQFCEHFLAPLCLASYLGAGFLSLLKLNLEGIPLRTASNLLPVTTWVKPSLLFHIHLHAKTIDRYAVKAKSNSIRSKNINKGNLLAMIDHLSNFISGLQLNRTDTTQWQNYDKETHYSMVGKLNKATIVNNYIDSANPSVVWDIGANDGFFSRSIAGSDRLVLSLDADPMAIEKNFDKLKQEKRHNIVAVLFDLVNPSPDLGWANQERKQLSFRSKPDLIMALALIHHIVITNNVPFINIAEYFAANAQWLIVEFVPEGDDKIKALPETAGKKLYTRKNFESAFLKIFDVQEERKIEGSERSLLLLRRK